MELLIRRVLLIANPAARRGAVLEAHAVRAFAAAGVRCTVARTEHPGHAAALAAAHGGAYDAVFALGGDGTAMEVVGALAHAAIPVGILPGGTGNLVARALGVPLRIRTAVPRLLAGSAMPVDLGAIAGGRHFAFSLGVGVDARTIHETPPALKRRFGVAAYLATATRATLFRRPFQARLEVDGEVVEREATAVMVVNFGSVLSGFLVLGPGIRPDDGMLDLCVFSPGHALESVRLAWRLVWRTFTPAASAVYRPGRTFRIACTPPQTVQADGELVGTTPVALRVDAGAASLLVPAGARSAAAAPARW